MKSGFRQDTSAAVSYAGDALESKDSASLSDHADYIDSTVLRVDVTGVSDDADATAPKGINAEESAG